MYEGIFFIFALFFFFYLNSLWILTMTFSLFSSFFTIKEETDYPLLFSSFRHHCGIMKRKQLLANHLKKHRLIKKKEKKHSQFPLQPSFYRNILR